MRKSKLETYEAILEALIRKPLTNDQISYEAKLDCETLIKHLDFLMQNSLVEERIKGNKTLYALTERGVAVLKALSLNKYLANVSETLLALDDATQVLPLMSDPNNEKENKYGNY